MKLDEKALKAAMAEYCAPWTKGNNTELMRAAITAYITAAPFALVGEYQELVERLRDATRYAERLTAAIIDRHYPEANTLQPLSGDLIGLLTQIDNLTAGLSRTEAAEVRAKKLMSSLGRRDNFIVDNGLWSKFVAELNKGEG